MRFTVIGAGLAGTEAAWQIANAGHPVTLLEMKPVQYSPAHTSPLFAELVCSNSLKAARLESAAGLLKEEMARLGSLTVPIARQCAVPAGGALAVDREQFASRVTAAVEAHPNITVEHRVVTEVPRGADQITVVASGPLTADDLAADIERLCPGRLSFYDAAAPIITAESVDYTKVFGASRYDRGGDSDYLNCPFNRAEYEAFINALVHAEGAVTHDFDVYEGCMPIEKLAKRGADAPRFGPGLEQAEIVRYGVMHRNSFIDSPRLLGADYALRSHPNIFFAGQITGVEGYMESAMSGILAGRNAVRRAEGKPTGCPNGETMSGALTRYISDESVKHFQPMGANFGILPPMEPKIRDKKERYAALSNRALAALDRFLEK